MVNLEDRNIVYINRETEKEKLATYQGKPQ